MSEENKAKYLSIALYVFGAIIVVGVFAVPGRNSVVVATAEATRTIRLTEFG